MGLGYSAIRHLENLNDDEYKNDVESVLDLDSDLSYSIISNTKVYSEIPNSSHPAPVQTNCYKDYDFCTNSKDLEDIIDYDNISFAPRLNNSNCIRVNRNKCHRNDKLEAARTISSGNHRVANFGVTVATAAAVAAVMASSTIRCPSSHPQLRGRYMTGKKHQQVNHHHQRLETPRRRQRPLLALAGCDHLGLLGGQCHRWLPPKGELAPSADHRLTESNSKSGTTFGLQGVCRRPAIDLPVVFRLGNCNNKLMMRSDMEAQQQVQQESPIHPGASQRSRSPSLDTTMSDEGTVMSPLLRSKSFAMTTICSQPKHQHRQHQRNQKDPSDDTTSAINGFGDSNPEALSRFLADQMCRLAKESRRQFLAATAKKYD